MNRSLSDVSHCFRSRESILMFIGSEPLVEALALADSGTLFSSVTLMDSAFLTDSSLSFQGSSSVLFITEDI